MASHSPRDRSRLGSLGCSWTWSAWSGLDDIVDHFTLIGDELDQLRTKSGATRLGFAVLLRGDPLPVQTETAGSDSNMPL